MHETGELYPAEASGSDVFRRVFTPQSGESAGGVVMAHGLGDHIGCHVLAAEMFCGRGWMSAGVDWPGHGHSEGKRGHIDGVEPAVRLIAETAEFVRGSIGPDKPAGLYAHSTGALFALHYLAMNQQGLFGEPTLFDWIWLSSPLLRPEYGQHPIKVKGAGLFSRLLPRITFDTGVRPERCRHVDLEIAKANGDYDLCHTRVSAKLGADLLRFGRNLPETARALQDPVRVLITQGEVDTICPRAFSREFAESIPASTTTYAVLEGLRHEPLREPENAELIEVVEDFLAGASRQLA